MSKMKETLRVAILGPTGQIGHAILLALLTGTSHEVVQLVSPQSEEKARSVALASEQSERITTVPVDLLGSSTDHIATILDGVDVVVSALNGKALDAQGKVQDAAAEAGVRRFYPSEYGMHHVYRPDLEDDNYGYLHPVRVTPIRPIARFQLSRQRCSSGMQSPRRTNELCIMQQLRLGR